MKLADFLFLFQINAHNTLNTDYKKCTESKASK